MNTILSQFAQRRILVTLLLGFASGLPLALVGSTLSAWYTVEGLSLKDVGWASLAAAPYTYKFVWAPLMDRWVPPFLGRRRGWIMLCQALLCITLACMIFITPLSHPKLLFMVACLVAFFSASQDIAVDAYRADMLHPTERPLGAAMATNGYRIAMLVSGGLALVIADAWGWKVMFGIMVILMGTGIITTWFGPEPVETVVPPKRIWDCTVMPFLDFLKRPRAVWILLFVVFYKFGDAFAGAMSQAFLLREIHFSLTEIGLMAKTTGFIATILGTIIGALWMERMGWFKALLAFGVLQAFSNLSYMVLFWSGPNYAVAGSAIFVENLCGGMGAAAFVSVLMGLCNARFTAFQYALLSSLSAVGRVYIGPLAGAIVENQGWNSYFMASILFSIPGLVLLLLLKNGISKMTEEQAQQKDSFVTAAG